MGAFSNISTGSVGPRPSPDAPPISCTAQPYLKLKFYVSKNRLNFTNPLNLSIYLNYFLYLQEKGS